MADREEQIIEAITTMAGVVNKLMNNVLKLAMAVKEIRKELVEK